MTSEQAARAERSSRPPSKPAGEQHFLGTRASSRPHRGKPTVLEAGREQGGGERAAGSHCEAPVRNASKRRFPDQGPGPAAPAAPSAADPDAQVRQLNLRIRHILDTEAEKAEAESDTPFHFTRGDRVKRLYVSGDQRRRLSNGELAIVGFRGRHHLVPRAAGERVRELRPEVFVFITAGEDGAGTVEEGYEGYEVPDELMW